MIEIVYLGEKDKIKEVEVQEAILGILQVLELEYGADRKKYEDDGGYVLVVDKEEDFQEIKNKAYIDCNTIIPEYVNEIISDWLPQMRLYILIISLFLNLQFLDCRTHIVLYPYLLMMASDPFKLLNILLARHSS